MLFQFFLRRILTYNLICQSAVIRARVHVVPLVREVLQLDWPLKFVIQTLQKKNAHEAPVWFSDFF